MKMLQKIKPTIFTILIISFIIGGTTGGLIGAVTGSLSSQYFLPWIKQSVFKQEVGRKEGEITGFQVRSPLDLDSSFSGRSVPDSLEMTTEEVVKKVSPSVVSIIVTKDLSKHYNLTGPDIFLFEDFFRSPFKFKFPFPQKENSQRENKQQVVGGGTGFVISKDGLILTNKHVVIDEEADYTVVMNNGQKHEAEVLARDPILDIAVVKIKDTPPKDTPLTPLNRGELPVVELGDSNKIEIGQTVIAIGNALGEYRNTVTQGIISGIDRNIVASSQMGSELLEGVIQTDAAINPGNSGGPLLNLSGQVIGINTAINREGQLLGFAIPINPVKKIIDSVKKHGRIVRPMLGVRYKMINQEIAEANNLPYNYGALIIRGQKPEEIAVLPGSPADKAGIKENDILLEINGQKMDQEHSLVEEIAKQEVGDEVELLVLSKGKERVIRVRLEERK